LAIIPVLVGSKENSNYSLDFCGKPLFAWSIDQAKEAKTVDQVYVYSDNEQMLDIANKFGVIPIDRSKELANDTTTSDQILLQALDKIELSTGSIPTIVVFLQANFPFREPEDIDVAVKKLLKTKADSLFSMSVLNNLLWNREGNELKRLNFSLIERCKGQSREPLYFENGSIYVFRAEILRKNNNYLGGKISTFEMPFWKSYKIETMEDIELFKSCFEKTLLNSCLKKENIQTIPVSSIDLIVYDFDGVMTDNRVFVLEDGTEGVIANRADGLGIDRFRELGIPQMILSTETNPVVKARGKKLVLEVIASCKDKRQTLCSYCEQNGYDMKRVVYLGNDLNDLKVMKIVGYPVAPADAHPEVRAIAKVVTRTKGGEGVIKELAYNIVTQ